MATCLHCGCADAKVKDSRTAQFDGDLVGVRTLICPLCGPRSQEVRDTGPAKKLSLCSMRVTVTVKKVTVDP